MTAESHLFESIADRISNSHLKKAILFVAKDKSGTTLSREVGVLARSVLRTNNLIAHTSDPDLVGIKECRRITKEKGVAGFPLALSEGDFPNFPSFLVKIIRIGNIEVGNVYKNPQKINEGDLLSVFRWYLYDGYARMIAAQIGVPDGKLQQDESDWISCGFAEALVLLAESGDTDARKVVKNMVEMEFIGKEWLLSDKLVDRAEKVSRG